MTACKQTASMGAAATDSKSAARKGKKAKGKLAVKSNGAEKPKTHDLPDVTRGLAVLSVSDEKPPEDEELALIALYTYQNIFWMDNFKGVYVKLSIQAIDKIAADQWKFFSDSDKAPYVAKARVIRRQIAEAREFKKTLKLMRVMTNKMMNLKM